MRKIPDLSPFTHQDEEWFKQPFTVVDVKGSVWNVATDRVWLVAAKGKSKYPRWPGNAAQLNVVLGLIQSVPVEPRVVTTEVLQGWVGSDPENKLGKIMGAVTHLGRLGDLLGLLPAGDVHMWDASSVMRQDPCLGIESKDLRIFLMGYKKDTEPDRVFDAMTLTRPLEDKPKDPPPEEWEGFDLVMSLEDD